MPAGKRPPRKIPVRVLRLPHAEGLPLPVYQTAGAAGLDLIAAVPDDAPVALAPGGYAMVPTGLILELPAGTEAQVRPRSGLAARHGVTILNSPGTIDSDYRGEVKVLLVNLGAKTFPIRRGERIAQLVLAPVAQARLIVAAEVSPTRRGEGGFGSTGLSSVQDAAARVGKRPTSKRPRKTPSPSSSARAKTVRRRRKR